MSSYGEVYHVHYLNVTCYVYPWFGYNYKHHLFIMFMYFLATEIISQPATAVLHDKGFLKYLAVNLGTRSTSGQGSWLQNYNPGFG